jgi:hypothetical protein
MFAFWQPTSAQLANYQRRRNRYFDGTHGRFLDFAGYDYPIAL